MREIDKNKMEFVEVKNTVFEMTDSLDRHSSTSDTEDVISYPEAQKEKARGEMNRELLKMHIPEPHLQRARFTRPGLWPRNVHFEQVSLQIVMHKSSVLSRGKWTRMRRKEGVERHSIHKIYLKGKIMHTHTHTQCSGLPSLT